MFTTAIHTNSKGKKVPLYKQGNIIVAAVYDNVLHCFTAQSQGREDTGVKQKPLDKLIAKAKSKYGVSHAETHANLFGMYAADGPIILVKVKNGKEDTVQNHPFYEHCR